MRFAQLLSLCLGVSVHLVGSLESLSDLNCPGEIEILGESVGNWTSYREWNRFLDCNIKPRLFSLATDSSGNNTQSEPYILGCTSLRGDTMPDLLIPWEEILAGKDEHHVDI